MALTSKTNSSTWALWSVTIIALVISILSLSYTLTNGKKDIVCVDAVKLISKYRGLEETKKALQSRNDLWKANMDTLQQEYQATLGEYTKSKAKSSPKELKLIEQTLQSKQRDIMNYEQSIKEQIRKQDEELAAKILAKVNDYLKRYGKQKGYTIILAATQMGNVAYTNEAFDITDEVLAGLNAEYQKVK